VKSYAIIVLGSLVLSACAGGLVPDKDNSSVAETCRLKAQKYVNSNSIDKYWRTWEYNQQYKQCMAESGAS